MSKRKYDKDKQGFIGCEGLATAIIIRAVQDWRYLCNGSTETEQCSFSELEEFFTVDCGTYLDIIKTDILAEDIYKQLQKERAKSILGEVSV